MPVLERHAPLIITGGCGIWLSNIIVEEVIEVDELDEGNISATAENKTHYGRLS